MKRPSTQFETSTDSENETEGATATTVDKVGSSSVTVGLKKAKSESDEAELDVNLIFCGGCISPWVAREPRCPSCRGQASQLARNHQLQALADAFADAHPEHRRLPDEVAALDAANKVLAARPFRVASSDEDDNDNDNDNYESGSEEDSEPVVEYCPYCPASNPTSNPADNTTNNPAAFACNSSNPLHQRCSNCQNLMPLRNLPHEQCRFCRLPFCDVAACVAVSDFHKLRGDFTFSEIPFVGCPNPHERQILVDICAANNITPQSILNAIVEKINDKSLVFIATSAIIPAMTLWSQPIAVTGDDPEQMEAILSLPMLAEAIQPPMSMQQIISPSSSFSPTIPSTPLSQSLGHQLSPQTNYQVEQLSSSPFTYTLHQNDLLLEEFCLDVLSPLSVGVFDAAATPPIATENNDTIDIEQLMAEYFQIPTTLHETNSHLSERVLVDFTRGETEERSDDNFVSPDGLVVVDTTQNIYSGEPNAVADNAEILAYLIASTFQTPNEQQQQRQMIQDVQSPLALPKSSCPTTLMKRQSPPPSSPSKLPRRRRKQQAPALSRAVKEEHPTDTGAVAATAVAAGASGGDTRARDFECVTCNNKFLRRQDLYRHEATHTRRRDFVCPYKCGSSFARSDALTRHVKGSKTCVGAVAAAAAVAAAGAGTVATKATTNSVQ
ncbi:hypothetical protein HK100_011649 [Physocladia obscura]|uniref:C2H2-type domain-containing protein n=1 Tax=Physocladia obscura TaxID=109957 RepID=A0AAD5T0X5_9FUNG|nr:hypothetical protein HK100_011649 [Physocladia obscura]